MIHVAKLHPKRVASIYLATASSEAAYPGKELFVFFNYLASQFPF